MRGGKAEGMKGGKKALFGDFGAEMVDNSLCK